MPQSLKWSFKHSILVEKKVSLEVHISTKTNITPWYSLFILQPAPGHQSNKLTKETTFHPNIYARQ